MRNDQAFSKVFRETDCIVISATEHQLPSLPIDFGYKFYALKADGTANFQVPLDYDCRGEFAADGTLTLHLPSPGSGVVYVWTSPVHHHLER